MTNDFVSLSLSFQNATPNDSSLYKISAKNDAGESQALMNITVDAEPESPSVEWIFDLIMISCF